MKKPAVLLLIVFMFCIGATTADVSAFAHKAQIISQGAAGVPVAVRLPGEVLSATDEGLADIRIYDRSMNETPYVIYQSYRPEQAKDSFSWDITGYGRSGKSREIMLKRPKGKGAFKDLFVQTPDADFVRHVDVYAERGGRFELAGSGTIYDFSKEVSLRSTLVSLPVTDADVLKVVMDSGEQSSAEAEDIRLKYRDLEFTASSLKKGDVKIDGFISNAPDDAGEKADYEGKSIAVKGMKADNEGNSIISLGLLNLPLKRLAFAVETSFFYREVEMWEAGTDEANDYRLTGSGVIYRIPGVSQAKLSIDFPEERCRYLKLRIINRDNPALKISKVDVGWTDLVLYFIPAQGQEYTLYFGAKNARAPQYEMRQLIPDRYDVLKTYDQWKLGAVTANESAKKPPCVTDARLQKFLVTALVLIIAALLGIWIYRLGRNIPQKPQ